MGLHLKSIGTAAAYLHAAMIVLIGEIISTWTLAQIVCRVARSGLRKFLARQEDCRLKRHD